MAIQNRTISQFVSDYVNDLKSKGLRKPSYITAAESKLQGAGELSVKDALITACGNDDFCLISGTSINNAKLLLRKTFPKSTMHGAMETQLNNLINWGIDTGLFGMMTVLPSDVYEMKMKSKRPAIIEMFSDYHWDCILHGSWGDIPFEHYLGTAIFPGVEATLGSRTGTEICLYNKSEYDPFGLKIMKHYEQGGMDIAPVSIPLAARLNRWIEVRDARVAECRAQGIVAEDEDALFILYSPRNQNAKLSWRMTPADVRKIFDAFKKRYGLPKESNAQWFRHHACTNIQTNCSALGYHESYGARLVGNTEETQRAHYINKVMPEADGLLRQPEENIILHSNMYKYARYMESVDGDNPYWKALMKHALKILGYHVYRDFSDRFRRGDVDLDNPVLA